MRIEGKYPIIMFFMFLIFAFGFLFELINNKYFIDKCIEQGGYASIENHDLICLIK